jgi:hypothetical protein
MSMGWGADLAKKHPSSSGCFFDVAALGSVCRIEAPNPWVQSTPDNPLQLMRLPSHCRCQIMSWIGWPSSQGRTHTPEAGAFARWRSWARSCACTLGAICCVSGHATVCEAWLHVLGCRQAARNAFWPLQASHTPLMAGQSAFRATLDGLTVQMRALTCWRQT